MVPQTTLIECVLDRAARQPEGRAILDRRPHGEGRDVSWRELSQAAQAVAWRLRSDFPGFTVMIALPNCAEAQVAMLGALWSGARTFPASPLSPEKEFRRQIDKLRKCVLIASKDLCGRLAATFDGTLDADSIAVGGATTQDFPDESLSSSILLQSSGTTGHPKIVRREMSSLIAMGQYISEAFELRPEDRILITIPLCHSFGIDMAVAAAISAGCEIELHSRYSPRWTRSALAEGAITIWPAVPLMFDAVSRSEEAPAPHRLRLAISAGSPLPKRVYEQFLEAYGTPIGQLYGASEFGSVTYNSPSVTPFDPGAVGRPFAGVEARILDIGRPDLTTPLAVGSSGEVAIRSPSMLSEYLDRAEVIDPSAFIRTGDIGSLDKHGVMRLTGRVKLMIDVGANKVNPQEVEAVLTRHPSVAEAVVVAVPFSDTAKRLKAVVLAREGARVDSAELRSYLRDHLISYKIPRIVEVVEDFPRSPTGKILRQVVQAEASRNNS